jgi:hypothetical protein
VNDVWVAYLDSLGNDNEAMLIGVASVDVANVIEVAFLGKRSGEMELRGHYARAVLGVLDDPLVERRRLSELRDALKVGSVLAEDPEVRAEVEEHAARSKSSI